MTTISFDVARSVPRATAAVGIPVYTEGAVPRSLGLSRAALVAQGFEGKVGQTLSIPANDGPLLVAVGMGRPGEVTTASLRRSAAVLARAVERRESLASTMADIPGLDARAAAQAVVEGITLALYRYTEVRSKPTRPALAAVTLAAEVGRHKALLAGIARGSAVADAVCLARDLANTPPSHLTATDLAERAVELASSAGLQIEVWDLDRLAAERCHGLLAVNAGSHDEARLIKLTYTPRKPTGSVALVGKGVMFDSGGLSLKTNEGMKDMKMDMSGAAAVLAVMTALRVIKPKVQVVAYLCCTDNLPSGTALKVSDVITYRNGATVEVLNTDAEGRLVLADALILAAESDADAIVDIATLTGSAQAALGPRIAALMSSSDSLASQLASSAERADEAVWRMPLPPEYRKMLDSDVADMKNVGGPLAGALTAGLFLQEFTGGKPWAHLDIAGPMRTEADEDWKVKGASAWGVRTLIELVERIDVEALLR